MRAILHIPSGELVEFVRMNARGVSIHNGLYIVFRLHKNLYSPVFPGGMQGPIPFRIFLKEDEHVELLMHSLMQCKEKFLAEEFTIIDL
jgi:hypothetical protein